MGVGSGNGGEKGGAVEGASVEEVGRFCGFDRSALVFTVAKTVLGWHYQIGEM